MKCFSALFLSLVLRLSLCDFVSDTASVVTENVSSELDLGVYKVTEELSNENVDIQPDDTADNPENFETQNLSDEMMVQDAPNNETEELDIKREEANSTEIVEVNTEVNEGNDSSSQSSITTTVSTTTSEESASATEEVENLPSTTTTQEVSTDENETGGESTTQTVSVTVSTTSGTEPATSDEVGKGDSATESSPYTTAVPETVTTISPKCKNRTESDNTTYNMFGDRNISIETALRSVEKGLSNQIRKVLHHYQRAGEVKIPGPSILPDPLDMPDMQRSISLARMTFTNMKLYGLSNFTVEHVNTDIDKMQVYVLLRMKRLVILGNYTMRSFFKRSSGPFNVTLLDVYSEGSVELRPDGDGMLHATDSEMDMEANDMKIHFKNLGSMLEGIVSGVGIVLFDSIKPPVLEKVNDIIRNDVNVKIKAASKKYVNSVKPVDLAVAEGRRYVKEKGYDPYHLRNYSLKEGDYSLNVTRFVLNGLSRFYRVGNVSLFMDVGTIQVGVHVATQRLTGECEWDVKLGKFYSRVAYTNLTVDHVQIRASVNQSLDVCKHPVLDRLDIEVGKVKVQMDRKQPLDIIFEYVVNSLPSMIRHVIVDAMEQPIKDKVQEILNSIDVEKIVDDNLSLLDTLEL